MSCCTTTVSNSVRSSEPVGQTSRQAAWVQCLHTSDIISHCRSPPVPVPGGAGCSVNATCRHELASSCPVLSNDRPSRSSPSAGISFHSLHATSHALQPMQTLV